MAAIETAESVRIMKHMNADHFTFLTNVLDFFGCIRWPVNVSNPKLITFESDHMIIEYGKQNNRLRYNHRFPQPILAGEARVKLEAMHDAARKGLGLSSATIKYFSSLGYGTAAGVTIFGLLQLGLLLANPEQIDRIAPWCKTASLALLHQLNISPTVINLARGIKSILLGPLAIAHLAEVLFVLPPILRKYNITSPLLKFQFMLATQIMGFPIWNKLQAIGAREERKLSKSN